MRAFHTLLIPFIFLLSVLEVNAQAAFLLRDSITVFYPSNYDSSQHTPSFAIINEPQVIAPLTGRGKTNVYFLTQNGWSHAYLNLDPNTDLYGTGEVTGGLIRNGTTRKLWNTGNFEYKRDRGQRLYQSHPWVLGVREDGTAFGVLADNTWKMEVTLGSRIEFKSQGPPFRVLMIERNSPQEVIMALADLTGKPAMPPLWALGFQQSRWSYMTDQRVREIADTFRLKQLPCDVIWMDIDYMDSFKIFTFSDQTFPNPEATNEYLHNENFKAIWMIDPGVKVEKGYSVYDEGTNRDLWVKTKEGKPYIGEVWPGDCVFPDFTQPETRKWWTDLYPPFMATGIDGVWNDMNEPAVFRTPDWTMPESNQHVGGDSISSGSHLRYHNVYGMLMVQASREGIKKANPDKRPFVLTRSNFLGGHRYAATWTGDNVASWKHLKMSIPMSLNLGLSGQPFSGPDIGGFSKETSPELFGHWIGLGAFYPFARAHTIRRTSGQEPWAFGEEIEKISRTALERRYKLLPYLYTLFYQSSQTGMPVMQPAFFADISNSDLREEDEAFLLGSDLLIVPKWAEDPVFPFGDWKSIKLFEDSREEDGYQPDLYVREGSIIPVGVVIQSTVDYSIKNLELIVSLDQDGKAAGHLYHDAGDGYRDYALIAFSAIKVGNKVELTTKVTEGTYPLEIEKLNIKLIGGDSSKSINLRYKPTIQFQ